MDASDPAAVIHVNGNGLLRLLDHLFGTHQEGRAVAIFGQLFDVAPKGAHQQGDIQRSARPCRIRAAVLPSKFQLCYQPVTPLVKFVDGNFIVGADPARNPRAFIRPCRRFLRTIGNGRILKIPSMKSCGGPLKTIALR